MQCKFPTPAAKIKGGTMLKKIESNHNSLRECRETSKQAPIPNASMHVFFLLMSDAILLYIVGRTNPILNLSCHVET